MQEKWSSFAKKPGQRHLAKSAVRWKILRNHAGCRGSLAKRLVSVETFPMGIYDDILFIAYRANQPTIGVLELDNRGN